MLTREFCFVNFAEDRKMEANIARLRITGRDKHYYKMALLRFCCIQPFKPRIKSHLLFAGIIRSSPFSPR